MFKTNKKLREENELLHERIHKLTIINNEIKTYTKAQNAQIKEELEEAKVQIERCIYLLNDLDAEIEYISGAFLRIK